ncbi:MAG TPA: ABC transporter permease [Acholeplasmataceae bacterium]|nr:ABC transporter permease [Acholeplasmataceae bacterium]
MRVLYLKHLFRSISKKPIIFIFNIFISLAIGAAFLVILSIKPLVQKAFLYNEENVYPNLDLVVDLENHYTKRFFSITPLSPIIADFETVVPAFSLPAQNINQKTYSLYFVDYEKFKPLINGPDYKIKYFEVLISDDAPDQNKTHSQFKIFDKQYDFENIASFKKDGVLSNIQEPVIIIDQGVLEQVYPLPIIDKLCNVIYLQAKADIELESLEEKVNSIYQEENVRRVNDYKQIKENADTFSFIVRLIGLIILLPLSFSLYLLIKLNFNRYRQEMLTLKHLGLTDIKLFFFALTEYIFYLIIGFAGSILFSKFILTKMTVYLVGENINFILNFSSIIFSGFIILLSYYFVIFFFSYYRFKQIEDYVFEKVKKTRISTLLIALLIFTSIFIILYYAFITKQKVSQFSNLITGFYFFAFAFIILVLVLKLILLFFAQIFKKYRRFQKIELASINANNLFYFILLTLLVSVITINIAVYTSKSFRCSIENDSKNLNFDYTIVGITLNHKAIEETLKAEPEIEAYFRGSFYQNIHILELDSKLPIVITADTKAENLVEIENPTNNLGKGNRIYIPKSYQGIYGLKVGEKLNLKLNNKFYQEFEISGFIDETFGVFSVFEFSEDNSLVQEQNYSAIFIKSKSGKLPSHLETEILSKNAVLKKVAEFYDLLEKEVNKWQNLINLFIITISICLLASILFIYRLYLNSKQRQQAILVYLGYLESVPSFLLKTILTIGTVVVMSIVGTLMFSKSIYYLTLFGRRYLDYSGIVKMALETSFYTILFVILIYLTERIVLYKNKNFNTITGGKYAS